MNDLPPDAQDVVRAFVDGLRAVLGDAVFAVYLYGAITFPDSREYVQDIDYHVILTRPLDDEDRHQVLRLRQRLVHQCGPLAEELDGYLILLDDLRWTAPPRHQLWPLSALPVDRAWALHCAHIHAGHVITVAGPDPRQIYPLPAWPELRAALFGEVRYVDQHIADAPAYCVLNAVRILYSFTTHEVAVSKREAAQWGLTTIPESWREPIRAALRVYRGDATPEDSHALAAGVGSFVEYIWHQIGEMLYAESGCH